MPEQSRSNNERSTGRSTGEGRSRSAAPRRSREESWPEIPDKLYFKIGEVSRITDVKSHVLRYWESEFGVLRPQRSETGQRLYRRRDVELLLMIKRLLYHEGFSIAGANKRLRQLLRSRPEPSADLRRLIDNVRREVEGLLQLVDED